MRSLVACGALAVACANAAPTAAPRALEVTPPPRAVAPSAAPASASPSASAAPASPEQPLAEELAAEAATPLPDAPPKTRANGDAAIVWLPDPKAERGYKSVLVENVAGKAKVVAQRKEPVLVGSKDLWVLRSKKLASRACDECDACLTDPPTCKRDVRIDLDEPFLKSLRTGKVLEPWSNAFAARTGCAGSVGDHETTLELEGGVGSVYFFSVFSSDQFCGGAHPMFATEPVTVDVDTGRTLDLTFPSEAVEALRKRAHGELGGGCVIDPKEVPTAYRATATYRANGELVGLYAFSMSAPYMCGTGPGHYSVLSEQEADWLPPELARWGKLPEWVATYAAGAAAKHVFLLEAPRARAAKRELGR